MDFFLVADPSTDGDDNLCLAEIDISLGLLGDFQYTAARGNTIYVYRDPMNNCLLSRRRRWWEPTPAAALLQR